MIIIIKQKIGNTTYPVLVNETITELFSQYLHSVYISFLLNSNFFTFKKIYAHEQTFSLYQCKKICKFYNIDDLNNLKNFNQYSNVYSYYVLKCLLSFNFNIINKLINKDIYDIDIYISKFIDKLNYKFINRILKKLQLNDNSTRMILFNTY
jgi:hypothetical protein